MPAIKTDNLVKRYTDVTAVNGVSLEIPEGEVFGLLGPNGAGKTTTFNMVAGLIKPQFGRVYADNTELSGMPMHKRSLLGIGYLTQEPSIFRLLTVENNLKAVLETIYSDKYMVNEKCDELLGKLGIAHIRKQKAILLSGGEKRRLEIARSLIREPGIMLLDEPFVGIDPIAVADIQHIIHNFKKEGMGILITDHNVRETLQVIDRAYIMYEGKILLSGTRDELLNSDEARKVYLGSKFSM